eukprot:gene14355-biopygen2065
MASWWHPQKVTISSFDVDARWTPRSPSIHAGALGSPMQQGAFQAPNGGSDSRLIRQFQGKCTVARGLVGPPGRQR